MRMSVEKRSVELTVENLIQHLNNPHEGANECDYHLCQISKLLLHDDVYRSNNVRLAEMCAIENNILPLFLATFTAKSSKSTLNLIVTLLSHVTSPLDFSCKYSSSNSSREDEKVFKAQNALLQYKKAFLSHHQFTETLVKLIRAYAINYDEMMSIEERKTSDDTSIAENVLFLLRNLLHVPSGMDASLDIFQSTWQCSTDDLYIHEEWQNVYRILVWNLLAQGIDDAILAILNLQDHQALNHGLIQLINLLFKDQPVCKLQKIIYNGRVLQESSDDELESDSSSSLQLSSSSNSLLSCEESSSASSSASSSGHRVQSKESEKWASGKVSDSGISSEQRTSSDDSSPSNESRKRAESPEIMEEGQLISAVDSMTIDDQPAAKSSIDLPGSSRSNTKADAQVDVMRESAELNTEMKNRFRNSREEQTSGISNGSSEEETRTTRKVIKAHHRSACQPNGSDSSDEYNKKPVAISEISCRKCKQVLKTPRYPSNVLQSKCSPSICMEAALEAINKLHPSLLASLVAPWDKKKLHRSYPLDLTSYIPSDEEVGRLLEDFVYKFLHNSFSRVALELTVQLMDQTIELDDSHYAWLISYFINFAVAVDLDYHHIESLLCPSTFAYLVHKGDMMNEELKILSQLLINPTCTSFYQECLEKRKILLRKMHLTVSALKELLNAIINYSEKCRSRDSCLALQNLRYALANMTNLHSLLLVYIRDFDSAIQSKQFLIDVIITHHIDMVLLEPVYLEGKFDLFLHLRKFATLQVMHQYGKILQDFETNGEYVNDCILTLMHHVAGDLMAPEVLFQPIILKTFSLIPHSKTRVKECWDQLIDYIMIKFVRAAKNKAPTPLETRRSSFDVNRNNKGDIVKTIAVASPLIKHDSLSLAFIPKSDLKIGQSLYDRNLFYWIALQFEQTVTGIIIDALTDDLNLSTRRSEILARMIAKEILSEGDEELLHGRVDASSEKTIISSLFALKGNTGTRQQRDALQALIAKRLS